MAQPTLGVMALYMNEKKQLEELRYFRRLLTEGEQMGLNIFLFTPEDVDHASKRAYALFYNVKNARWERKWTPLPQMIFDRCRFQRSPRFKKLREFRALYPDLLYLNRPLANKWIIYNVLKENAKIRPHLPETLLIENSKQLFQFLRRHPISFLKPTNGTGGRGILKIQALPGLRYRIEGRDLKRRIIVPKTLTPVKLRAVLQKWRAGVPYIVQQGIDLKLKNGRVHDYRLLIQKNGQGEWEITGCAGRVGAKNSVTSNLHGGGRAVRADSLLKKWFSSSEVEQVKQKMNQLGLAVVNELERNYKQMCELALDIAVDRNGQPWLLETNPKPAREIFNRIGEKETYRKAIIRPLEYALWLYENHKKK